MRKIVSALSSRAFLVWLVLAWILFYAIAFIWIDEAFSYFTNSIRDNIWVQIPCLLFLISGYLNLFRAGSTVWRRGKSRFVLWIALPFGTMLFFTGFFFSLYARQFEWILIGEGSVVRPRWSVADYLVTGMDAGLKEDFLNIDKDIEKGIFRYEPKVYIMDPWRDTFEVGAFPPAKVGDTYFHILNFGLAPGVRFYEGDVMKDEGQIPLKIVTPGAVDTFEIAPYPYRFTVSLQPERVIQKGQVVAKKYSIRKPLYRVKISRGEKILVDTIAKERITFEGHGVEFFDPVIWIQLEAVRDRAVILLVISIFMIIGGLPLYFSSFMLRKKKDKLPLTTP